MAVSKSGSNSEEIQNIKLNFERRSRQKDKAHEEQMKVLQAQHEQDLNKVVENSKEDIQSTRIRTQSKLSDKEQKYQEEIESLKALYQKKLAERE